MTITEIIETPNNELEKMKILKEKMDLYVEGVPDFLPNYRNGPIALFCGSGGSGKTQLLMHLFSKKDITEINFTIYIIFVLHLLFYH